MGYDGEGQQRMQDEGELTGARATSWLTLGMKIDSTMKKPFFG